MIRLCALQYKRLQSLFPAVFVVVKPVVSFHPLSGEGKWCSLLSCCLPQGSSLGTRTYCKPGPRGRTPASSLSYRRNCGLKQIAFAVSVLMYTTLGCKSCAPVPFICTLVVFTPDSWMIAEM